MKHEQKVKAVKDLQEEYDRRSEIEEQAFALLAEGKFKEAQELLDSLDDKQALEMLKESVEEYGEEQTKRDVYCLMQHIVLVPSLGILLFNPVLENSDKHLAILYVCG